MMAKIRRKFSIYTLYAVPATLYLIIFFYIPILTIIVYSFWKGGPLY